MSSICYDSFNRPYRCYDNNGLGYGARIGIGIGVAALVVLLFALCGYWRRKQLQKQFSKYRPPALPYAQSNTGGTGTGYSYGQGNNPYSSNPPPPQNSSFNGGNPYGFNPPPPPATYQPSMAGQYTGASKTGTAAGSDNAHEHGYEWEQAREAERLEREQQAGGHAPPGYDVSNTQTPMATGSYAPPPGAPPTKHQ